MKAASITRKSDSKNVGKHSKTIGSHSKNVIQQSRTARAKKKTYDKQTNKVIKLEKKESAQRNRDSPLHLDSPTHRDSPPHLLLVCRTCCSFAAPQLLHLKGKTTRALINESKGTWVCKITVKTCKVGESARIGGDSARESLRRELKESARRLCKVYEERLWGLRGLSTRRWQGLRARSDYKEVARSTRRLRHLCPVWVRASGKVCLRGEGGDVYLRGPRRRWQRREVCLQGEARLQSVCDVAGFATLARTRKPHASPHVLK